MLVHEVPSPGYGKVAGVWYVCVPGERRARPVGADAVIEHEDGTISIRYLVTTERWQGWLHHGEFLGMPRPDARLPRPGPLSV